MLLLISFLCILLDNKKTLYQGRIREDIGRRYQEITMGNIRYTKNPLSPGLNWNTPTW